VLSELTIGGGLLGSPLYMAPEQIRSEKLDPRCDVYSLGVTLYELTVGRPPFEADAIERLLAMHLFEDPPRPSTRVPGYDPTLEAIVMKMLAKKADERPTARALRAQLRDIVIARTAKA
jgi:serine/threonine protein kinase